MPAAVDLFGPRLGARGVRAGVRLGQAPGADLLALGQRDHPAAPLLLVAELVDVVGAQRVVGGDRDADRRVDLRQLGDHQHVFDVAHAGAAVLLREDDPQEAELAGLLDDVGRKALGLVDLVDDRVDLAQGEIAGGFLHGALVFGERKIHWSAPGLFSEGSSGGRAKASHRTAVGLGPWQTGSRFAFGRHLVRGFRHGPGSGCCAPKPLAATTRRPALLPSREPRCDIPCAFSPTSLPALSGVSDERSQDPRTRTKSATAWPTSPSTIRRPIPTPTK